MRTDRDTQLSQGVAIHAVKSTKTLSRRQTHAINAVDDSASWYDQAHADISVY